MFNISITDIIKNIFPDLDITNVYWILGVIATFVIGTIVFLIRHKVKICLLDPSPKPRLRLLYEGSAVKEISISMTDNVDIMEVIKHRSEKAIKTLSQKFPLANMDAYNDMSLLFEGNFNAASNYNADVKSYIETMYEYYKRTIADEEYSKYIVPVEFILLARGRAICSNLQVSMDISGTDLAHVYSQNSTRRKQGEHDKEPEQDKDAYRSEFYSFFPSEKVKYNYNEWKLTHIGKQLLVKVETLIPGIPDKESVPLLYIDRRFEQTISVKWKINGVGINESGKNGFLYIKVK